MERGSVTTPLTAAAVLAFRLRVGRNKQIAGGPGYIGSMDSRVTPLSQEPQRTHPPLRSGHKWTGVLLVTAGIAFLALPK